MKPYEFTGRITHIGQTQNITPKFAKRIFVVEAPATQDGFRPDVLAFELTKSGQGQDHTGDIQRFRKGDQVKVKFYIGSRESATKPGNWFWNCRAVEVAPAESATAPEVQDVQEDDPVDASTEGLPF